MVLGLRREGTGEACSQFWRVGAHFGLAFELWYTQPLKRAAETTRLIIVPRGLPASESHST